MNSDLPEVRASDAERERTVEQLRRHALEGRLTLEEFAERIDWVYGARTVGELEVVMRDLPAGPVAVSPVRGRRAQRFTISVFSGSDRKGRWRVARRHWVISMFGGSDLDLRDAEVEGGASTIYVLDLFGGTDLYVPDRIEVDFHGFALFGGVDEHGPDPPSSPAAFLRIVALSVFGGTDLWRVPRGAKGKRKDLRRAARAAEHERQTER